MKLNITQWLNSNRNILGWLLCAGSLVACFALQLRDKPIDLTVLVPAIIGIYVSGETVKRVGTVNAAARDPKADLESIVRTISGREKEPSSNHESASKVDFPD